MPLIRKARPEEADAVRDIVLAAYRHYAPLIGAKPGPMLDDYAARIDAGQAWVVEDAGALAGVLVLEDGPDCFLLDNVAIHPSRQGEGLGRLLLDHAEAEARAAGWDRITLYTHVMMTANIEIYRKRGYAETERRREKGFDRVYMVKQL